MSLLLLIYLRDGPNMCSHCTKLWHKTSYPIIRDQRGAVSFPHRNRAEITVRMCEQNPYPLGVSWRRKSIPPHSVYMALEET